MTAKALDRMSDDELVAENQRLMREKDEIRQRQLELGRILSERDAQRRAEQLLDGMDETQIQAVAAIASARKAG